MHILGRVKGVFVVCAILVGASGLAHAAPFALTKTFDDPMPTIRNLFGKSVAISGDIVLIGAVLADTKGNSGGQAYLFSAATGALLRTFYNPMPTTGDQFGNSVSVSGNYVLIGSFLNDTKGGNVGQVHLFSAATGVFLRTLNDPTSTIGDEFGKSVSVSGDHVLIGAALDDTNGGNVGQAHLFSAASGELLRTFDDPTPTTADNFGFSVSVSERYVLIGAPFDDTNGDAVGQAHLFSAATGALLRTFNDPKPTVSDRFGFSVSVSGDYVLIGASSHDTGDGAVGQAHLFSARTGALLQTFNDPTPTTGDRFGFSVSTSGGGVLIGAIGDDTKGRNVGQVHLFSAVVDGVSRPEPSALVQMSTGLLEQFVQKKREAMDRRSRNAADIITLYKRSDCSQKVPMAASEILTVHVVSPPAQRMSVAAVKQQCMEKAGTSTR